MNQQNLSQALRRTWDVIGGDILACGECDAMPRSEVIEVVLDANYLEMYGDSASKEDIAAFRKLSYDEQENFAGTVFTCRSYGY